MYEGEDTFRHEKRMEEVAPMTEKFQKTLNHERTKLEFKLQQLTQDLKNNSAKPMNAEGITLNEMEALHNKMNSKKREILDNSQIIFGTNGEQMLLSDHLRDENIAIRNGLIKHEN